MSRYQEPRFEHDYVPTRHVVVAPTQSWWKAMPWVVRAAIWITALFALLPLLVFLIGGSVLAGLLTLGVLVR